MKTAEISLLTRENLRTTSIFLWGPLGRVRGEAVNTAEIFSLTRENLRTTSVLLWGPLLKGIPC